MKKTSKIRKIAKDVVYASPDENPFKDGTQFHKQYIKFKVQYDNMEARRKDLEEIYGGCGT